MGKYTAAVSHYYFLNLAKLTYYFLNMYICKADITKIFRVVGKNVGISYITYAKKYYVISRLSSLYTLCFHEKSNTNSRYLRFL